MSLSAEEKRQILRERRQAKMAQGNASNRLNEILSNGSSVKSAKAVSVLDKTVPASDSVDATAKASGNTFQPTPITSIDPVESKPVTPLHGDPEVPDISKLLHQNEAPEEQDMDAMFQKIFASAGVNADDPQNPQDASAKFFADLMKAVSDEDGQGASGFGPKETKEETTYQQQMAQYQSYQQSAWKARFLLVRFLLHTFNFFYHYRQYEAFQASSYSYIRSQQVDGPVRQFFTYFLSVEIAVISSYFMVMSKNGLLRVFSRNHAISKVISLASGLYPQARQFQPYVDNALVYWSGFSILLSDIMLMVVYFGIVSVLAK